MEIVGADQVESTGMVTLNLYNLMEIALFQSVPKKNKKVQNWNLNFSKLIRYSKTPHKSHLRRRHSLGGGRGKKFAKFADG